MKTHDNQPTSKPQGEPVASAPAPCWIIESGKYGFDDGRRLAIQNSKSAALMWIRKHRSSYVRDKNRECRGLLFFESKDQRRWLDAFKSNAEMTDANRTEKNQ